MITTEELHALFLQCSGVSTDTRNIQKENLFVCLKGERFDANQFAEEALQKGAKYCLIDNPRYHNTSGSTVLVEDCLVALQKLSSYHREYLGIPIIALTGSNGKTTTKELIFSVLIQKFNTKATKGNLNNHIGVPLTILSFDKETQIGVVEMGANHQKEIEFLCQIAKPDYGYITNFGKAHLEGFGGVEGVIKGKSEMYSYLISENKTIIVNLDDNIQREKTENVKRYTFSTHDAGADVYIKSMTADPFVQIQINDLSINSHLIGGYNAGNICAAITIGKYFDIGWNQIKQAIESYVPENNRSQILELKRNKIILDAYNANPSSMLAAIENFAQLQSLHKIIVLGDMFELGQESSKEHLSLITRLKSLTNTTIYLVGKHFFEHQNEAPNFFFFPNFEEFSNHLSKTEIRDNLVLIKGSRGMALERTLEYI